VLGHPVLRTPNMDQLANDGVLFLNHYAQATPCAPSRSSIHTGMYLHNHRCVKNGTPLEQRFTNWAQECRKYGYKPSLFGYTDSARDPRYLDSTDPRLMHYSEPLAGIDSHSNYEFDVPREWVRDLDRKGYSIPERLFDLYETKKTGVEWEEGGPVPLPLNLSKEDHESYFMVDQCMNWVAEQEAGWMPHLSLLRPHPPFVAPEPYNQMYMPRCIAIH
jgi:arylsulfatase A-like enzyme